MDYNLRATKTLISVNQILTTGSRIPTIRRYSP